MKKTGIFVAIAAVLVSVFSVSCTENYENVKIDNDMDSLSYAFGVANTAGLIEYLEGSMGVDSTQVEDLIRGIKDAVADKNEKEKAYLVGLQIGSQLADQMLPNLNNAIFGGDSTKTINKEVFFQGFYGSLLGQANMTVEEASTHTEVKMAAIKSKLLEENFGAVKEEGIAFLANNAKAEGVQVTESGLQYKVITQGTGAKPLDTDKVKVHYVGKLINGETFDSSIQRNEAAEFVLNQVIPGWTEGLQLMPVGSKYLLYIPSDLAYGDKENPVIPPFSTLIFEVELLEIVK